MAMVGVDIDFMHIYELIYIWHSIFFYGWNREIKTILYFLALCIVTLLKYLYSTFWCYVYTPLYCQ
jgi:hypothetical protein